MKIIKGIQDSYKIHASSPANVSTKYDDTAPPIKNKGEYNSFDKVNISSQGSFQTKLNSEIKKYSTAAQSQIEAQSDISTSKIAELKLKYSNNNCPVSGTDVARAMLDTVCGTKFEQ